MGVRLPAEYQEVEYLESTGEQYIDTGVLPAANLSFYCKFNMFSAVADGYGNVFGSRVGSSNKEYQLSCYNNGTVSIGTRNSFKEFYPNTINTVQFDGNRTVLVNGNPSTIYVSEQLHDWPIILFGLREHVSVVQLQAGQIYNVSFGDVANFIPCYRKSDDEPGMYDLVSKTFYTNQGTGEFLVGPDVVNHISPRLMDRRRALIAKLTSLFRKVITSQTGLVSFDTNVEKPMKVTCEFSPKQDLHGYDNPWPAGGGKNLLPLTVNYLKTANTGGTWNGNTFSLNDVTFTIDIDNAGNVVGIHVNGTASANTSFIIGKRNELLTVGAAYTFSGSPADGDASTYCMRVANPSWTAIVGNRTLTMVESTTNNILIYIASGATCNNKVFTPMVCISTATDPTVFVPYENICPISGWTGLTGARVGKNLVDISQFATVYSNKCTYADGVLSFSSMTPAMYTTGIPTRVPSGATLSWQITAGTAQNFRMRFRYADGTAQNIPAATTTFVAPKEIIAVCIDYTASGTVTLSNFMASVEPSDYVPYQGQTLPIPFNNPGTYDFLPIQTGTGDPSPENIRPITPGLTLTRDDNTTLEVYGGSLTVNADGTGSLTSAYYNLDCKSIIWRNANGASGDFVYFYNRFGSQVPECLYTSGQLPLCKNVEKYSHGTIENPYDQKISCACVFTTASRIGFAEGSGIDTIEKFNAWLDEQEVCQIVYPLKEPTTYILSVAETSRAFEALGLGKNLGPLYGGTVTINEDGSADVVSSWVKHMLGQLSEVTKSSGQGVWAHRFDCMNWVAGFSWDYKQGDNNYMCSELVTGSASSNGHMLSYTGRFSVYDDTISTVAEFREKYANTEIVYEMKDGLQTTYHFDNIGQLVTFIGTNNVWSDLNGAITAEYYKKQQ